MLHLYIAQLAGKLRARKVTQTRSALVTIGLVRAIGFGDAELVFVHLLPKHDNGRLA